MPCTGMLLYLLGVISLSPMIWASSLRALCKLCCLPSLHKNANPATQIKLLGSIIKRIRTKELSFFVPPANECKAALILR